MSFKALPIKMQRSKIDRLPSRADKVRCLILEGVFPYAISEKKLKIDNIFKTFSHMVILLL